MSSGENSVANVYLGFWTNWSQGAAAGLTYTTTLDNGAFFIAFLALFVTFTGTCFWSIVAFVIHQKFSRQAPQNAIYHQQQAILRTSDTSSAALWRLITMSWAWRKKACAASLKSTFIPLVASLATFSAFTIAGIFSSRVASSRGGEVLIDGLNCATVNLTLMAEATDNTAEYYGASRVRSSFSYKSVCYSGSGSTDSCRTFARSTLPYTVTRNVPCPFPGGDRICHSGQGAIRLDSGFLNSHHDLGINAPPSSRYLYRTVSECSPLQNGDYVRYNETESPKTLQFLYGNSPIGCGNGDGCTVEVSTSQGSGIQLARTQYTISYVLLLHQIGFETDSESRAISRWQLGQDADLLNLNLWRPIPELALRDADVNAIFLEPNSVMYATPVHDPWFSANDGPILVDTLASNITAYRSDQAAQALGCTQRYQFCNPALPKNISCTAPMGIFEAAQAAKSTLFTDPQARDAFEWSSRAIQNLANGFHEVVTILGGGSLLATDTLSGIGQAGLPDNQWEREVEGWFKFTLADLQRAVLDQATGPLDPKAASYHSAPQTAGGRSVCSNQKIRSDSYTSFNVLGLIIIFAVGGLIMLISFYLPLATARIQRNRNPYASLEWVSTDTLQLQRLAHEAVGAGEWEGACDDYPIARKHDLLAVLDITNPKHPILRARLDAVETIRMEEDDKKQYNVRVQTVDSTQASDISLDFSGRRTDMC